MGAKRIKEWARCWVGSPVPEQTEVCSVCFWVSFKRNVLQTARPWKNAASVWLSDKLGDWGVQAQVMTTEDRGEINLCVWGGVRELVSRGWKVIEDGSGVKGWRIVLTWFQKRILTQKTKTADPLPNFGTVSHEVCELLEVEKGLLIREIYEFVKIIHFNATKIPLLPSPSSFSPSPSNPPSLSFKLEVGQLKKFWR